MCPLKIHILKPEPLRGIALGCEAFERWLSYEGLTIFYKDIRLLSQRPQRAPLPLLPGANTAGRWPSVNQKQVLATESESALILTFPGPRTGEVNLYINKPPGYGVCQSSPNSGGDAEQSR